MSNDLLISLLSCDEVSAFLLLVKALNSSLSGMSICLSWSLCFWSCLLALWINKTQQEDVPFCKTGFYRNLFLPLEAHLLQTFYRSTLEKYYQISRSGPWSRTRGITFRKINETFWRRPLFSKNVFKIFLIYVHLYKFSFLNILNTYRVSSNYFWLHWVLAYSIIVSRIKKRREMFLKISFSYVNSEILIFFSFCVHESRTKDHTYGPRTIEHGHVFSNYKQNI